MRKSGSVAGAGALSSLMGNVTASIPSESKFEDVLEHPKVQRLLDELNTPNFIRSESQMYELDPEDLESEAISGSDPIRFYTLQAQEGSLLFAESSGDYNDELDGAVFRFGVTAKNSSDDDRRRRRHRTQSTSKRSNLPEEYQDFSENDGAGLLSTEEGIQFIRNATDEENEFLAAELDKDPANIRGIRHEDGYWAVEATEESEEEVSGQSAEKEIFSIELSDASNQSLTSQDLSSIEVESTAVETTISAQDHDSGTPCFAKGLGCVSAAKLCADCMAWCVASAVTTVGAILVCIGCLFVVCSIAGVGACVIFLDCFNNHYGGHISDYSPI